LETKFYRCVVENTMQEALSTTTTLLTIGWTKDSVGISDSN
jgi:hypothetical protein